MEWNWTRAGWPHFTFDAAALPGRERRFRVGVDRMRNVLRRVSDAERDMLRIEILCDDALKTSQIEGEVLDRAAIRASLLRLSGLGSDNPPTKPAEHGVAEMTIDVHRGFAAPLDHDTLFRWHRMLMAGSRYFGGIDVIGGYRAHPEPMQIVSGRIDNPTVHYEAPPSRRVPFEMAAFVDWFNDSAPDGRHPLPALTRAGIGHLHFESIHPFEDGNGRLGRALAEKSLAQNLGHPSLVALALTMESDRNAYYDALSAHQKTLDVTGWLLYFAETVLAAQRNTLKWAAFHVGRARFGDRHRGRFSERQEKAIARMFREGPEGFGGGLSLRNYASITRSLPETADADLRDLVDKGALTASGEGGSIRYALLLPELDWDD